MIREAGIPVMAHRGGLSTEQFERNLYENPQCRFLLYDAQGEFEDIKMFWQAFAEWIRQTFKKYFVLH